MADGKEMAVVETSMANPKQAVNVLNNLDKVTASTTPTPVLQQNADVFKQQENNTFFDSEAWADYKSDMLRAYSKKYPGFASMEVTAENPAYTSIINRYGDAIANRAQVMHSTYAKANNWFSRFGDAYNVHRYGLRAAAARKGLSNAILSGDEAEIAKAKMKYQSERRKSYEEGVGYEEYGDTLMSLLASMGRNPETIPVEIAGAIAAPYTGGASAYAANLINAAIIGADTYTVEAGGALEELDKETPNISEEQKHEAARKAGAINAAVEVGLFAVGGNVLGRGLTSVGSEVAIKSTMRAVKKETGKEITRDAAKEMIKLDFLKAAQKPAAEATFKSTVKQALKDMPISAAGEGWQETFQNTVTNAMLASVKNGTTLTQELVDDWADFLVDPFSEKHADKWETFINVSLASLIPGAAFQGVSGAVRSTGKKGLGGIQEKATGAYNNTLGLSQLFNWHKNGDAKNAIGASNAVLEDQIKRGEVSGKLYTTVEQIKEMQEDPEIAEALAQMGVAQAMDEAAENGGIVELDLLAYDKVVNESQNEALFQKMRNYLSFSDTTMSINEFNQFINSKGKEVAALITDDIRNDQESVYNKLKAMALKAGRTAERAEGYAVLGHLLLNNLQALTNGEKNDILDRLTISVGNEQGYTTERLTGGQPTTEVKQPAQGLAAVDGSTLATFDTQGNLKDEVWQQIRNLFPAEKLQQVYTSEPGGSRTFEELLRGTVDKPQQVAQEYKQHALEMVAQHFDITPEQLTNAIRLARGEAISTAPGTADVNVGGMVDNTFTENPAGDAQVYHMVVYAGSRTDYDKPSLTAIGSGEGNQSHGWGLYYALDKAVAEAYREAFTADNRGRWTYKGNSLADVEDETAAHVVFTMVHKEDYYGTKLEKDLSKRKEQLLNLYEEALKGRKEKLKEFKQELPSTSFMIKEQQEVVDRTKKQIKFLKQLDVSDIQWQEPEKGQVIEADIPEVNYLLDEQESFSNQSPHVKKALERMLYDDAFKKFHQTDAEDFAEVEITDWELGFTGGNIYDRISNLLDSDKAASQLMEKYGIKGITYDGQHDGRCFVIFNDKDVKVLRKKFDNLGKTLFMFVGTEQGNTAALPQGLQDRIAQAKSMMAEGKSDKEVFEATRLHIAPDGKLRIQISDRDAQLTEDSGRYLKRTPKGLLKQGSFLLGDVLDHELLFEVYPGLKDLPVTISGERKTYASRFGGLINLSIEEAPYRIRQSILHEVQHIIQHKEGWARGGTGSRYKGDNQLYWERARLIKDVAKVLHDNKVLTYWPASEGGELKNLTLESEEMRAMIDTPAVQKVAAANPEVADQIKRIKELNDKLEGFDSRLAFVKYWRLFGEAESRLTEKLSYKSQEELDKIDPYEYFDVNQFTVKDQNNHLIREHVVAPKNTQDTGEFFVEFDAESGRSIVDGTLVEAGRTTSQDGKYNIRLAPEANAVTFAHELFHVFSLEMQRVYNNGTITDFWKKQADKMFKMVDAQPQVDPVDPTVARYFLTTAQEERLANMFTTFLMKGKIENNEVRGLLSKLIDLFKKTYRQLDGAGLTPLALDANAFSFFNTVVSSQDAIEEIQRNAGLLEIAQPEGVDRELYDYYIANLAASKVEASNDLRRKWYAIETYKKSAEYTKKLQALKDEAKAELLEEDKYKILAQASLHNGEDKAQQTLMWAEKNMPEANYTLGDITDIIENTPSLEEASTKAADEAMEQYIAKRFNITPQDIGFREERNRAKVRALLAEAVMQRGGTLADVENEIKKADAASDKHLAKTSVYQILNLQKWKDREAAAVERYGWARQQDRKDLMSAERYNQAVLNLIMIKSNGFKAEYQKLSALFDKLQTRQKKYKRKDDYGTEYGPYEHRYHAEDWELLRSISEKFGNKIRDGRRSVKNVHEQLKDWIKTQVENRFTTVAGLEDFLPFIDRGFDGSIGAMKGKDFKKLWAVMHTIDSIAMREQQLYLDGQYEEMNQYIADTLEFRNKMAIKTDEDKNGWYSKYFGRYGTWTNPEPLLRAIFPEKVFQKIFLPMFNGALQSEAQAKLWIDTWKKAKAKINTSNETFVMDDGSQITYGETAQKTMTYGDVANLLIAMGAEHAYENYKLKFGLSDEQATRIVSQAIKRNANYVEFMNTTWKVYGEATEKLNESFQERTNELFVRKEHRAFEVDGIKFEGGYVPEDKHYLALVRELGTWNQGMKNKVENKNEKLITKLADGDVLSIIDITETKLSQSAKWAYAATPYNNVKKFIERPEISGAIGDRAFNFIKDWLQNWDTPHFDESGVWRPLTRVTTIAALGARASTALLQLSGIVQSFAHLGPTYLARGMLQFVRENGFFHPFKLPASKSLYMATRIEDPFSSMFGAESQGRKFKDILNSYNAKSKLGKAGTALLSAYQTVAMTGIQIIDGWVATITWMGARAKALDQGMTVAEAEAEADSAVRITQSDATQISRSSAMQEPWARSVTAFATWTMAMRSQVVALSSSKHYRKDMAMWITSYAVMSSFIEAFLKEMVEPADEGEEDKEMLERIMNSWYNKIVEAVGTQAMPFAGTGASISKAIAAALVNTDDEKIFKVFAGGSVPALQYAWRAGQAGAQALTYMRTGEEEDRDKLLIQASGLMSYEIKKRVKQALED